MLPKMSFAVVMLAFACSSPDVASATVREWSGGFFGGGEFTDPGSWFNGVPTNNTISDFASFYGFAAGPLNTTVNLSVPRSVHGIALLNPIEIGAAPNFTFQGSKLTLGHGGIFIDFFAGLNHVIDAEVGLAAVQEWYLLRNLRVTGALSGTGELTKSGMGRLTLAASNTNTGDINIIDGTVWIEGAGRISDRSNVLLLDDPDRPELFSPVLTFDGMTDAINGLFGEGEVRLRNGATLVIGNSINGSRGIGNFAGTIYGGGDGGLIKRGPGTFILSDINYYDGGTARRIGRPVDGQLVPLSNRYWPCLRHVGRIVRRTGQGLRFGHGRIRRRDLPRRRGRGNR